MTRYSETAADSLIKNRSNLNYLKTKNGVTYEIFNLNGFDFFTLNLNKHNQDYYLFAAEDIAIKTAEFINKRKNPGGVLFIGLGNPHIAADSLGFLTIEKLKNAKNNNLILENHSFLFLDIFAKTGIQNSLFIKNIAKNYKNVVIIDSLATKKISNMGAMELSDFGLKNINKNTVFSKKSSNIIFGLGAALILGDDRFLITFKDINKKVDFFSDIFLKTAIFLKG